MFDGNLFVGGGRWLFLSLWLFFLCFFCFWSFYCWYVFLLSFWRIFYWQSFCLLVIFFFWSLLVFVILAIFGLWSFKCSFVDFLVIFLLAIFLFIGKFSFDQYLIWLCFYYGWSSVNVIFLLVNCLLLI